MRDLVLPNQPSSIRHLNKHVIEPAVIYAKFDFGTRVSLLFLAEKLIIQPRKWVSRLKGITGFPKMYDIMGISLSLFITAARKTMKSNPK